MRLFLIGMMGSGKSYWAKLLAVHLNVDVIDLDAFIETKEQRTIAEIFEEKGEAYFREKEALSLRTFEGMHHLILATGGGTPCFHDNIQWMNEHGITIWLNEPTSMLTERLKAEKNHRPLVAALSDAELKSFIEKKIEERKPFYRQAKFILQGEDISLEKLLDIIKSEKMGHTPMDQCNP